MGEGARGRAGGKPKARRRAKFFRGSCGEVAGAAVARGARRGERGFEDAPLPTSSKENPACMKNTREAP